jgi:hypothetical protein
MKKEHQKSLYSERDAPRTLIKGDDFSWQDEGGRHTQAETDRCHQVNQPAPQRPSETPSV